MDDANIMCAKVFEFTTVKDNFTYILSEVKLCFKGLKSASADIAFQKDIANKLRNHMEYGLHNEVATDFEDIVDNILQRGH